MESSPFLRVFRREIESGSEWFEIDSIEIIPEFGLIGIFAILEKCYWRKEAQDIKIMESDGNVMNLPSPILILPIIFNERKDFDPVTNLSCGIPVEYWYPYQNFYVKSECLQFFQCLPQDHLYAIRGMDLTKENYQFRLLKAFSTNYRFFQLFKSNKGLGFYYFSIGLENSLIDENLYINLLNKKQREIGSHLGFNGNEISFLKKIDPELLQQNIIRDLIGFLRLSKYEKVLRSNSFIYSSTYYFLLYLKKNHLIGNINNLLLEDIEESLGWSLIPYLFITEFYSIRYRAIKIPSEFKLFKYLSKMNTNFRVSNCYELNEKGNKLLEILTEKRILKSKNKLTENIPFLGNLYIEPIVLERELFLEGKNLENCVFNFQEEVKAGYCFLYRIIAPERATMSIESYGGNWRLSAIKTFKNALPNENTWIFVKKWLDENAIEYQKNKVYYNIIDIWCRDDIEINELGEWYFKEMED